MALCVRTGIDIVHILLGLGVVLMQCRFVTLKSCGRKVVNRPWCCTNEHN